MDNFTIMLLSLTVFCGIFTAYFVYVKETEKTRARDKNKQEQDH